MPQTPREVAMKADVSRWLDATIAHNSGRVPDVDAAWSRLSARCAASSPTPTWRRHPGWMLAAGAAVLIGALGFTPAGRSATDRMLSLFRLNAVTAVPINDTALQPLYRNGSANLIAHFLSNSITVNHDEPNQVASNAAAATGLAGFSVLTPEAAPGAAHFLVTGAKDLSLRIDRQRAQTLIDTIGPAGLVLPADLDHAVISAHLARSVAIGYGACPHWSTRRGDHQAGAGAGCTVIDEGPSPQVSLPPGLDMRQLAVIGLQLLGMTPAEAQQYCQTIDWNSTLVVPFPSSMASSRSVNVDGNQGILLTSSRPDRTGGAGYVLIWAHQGMLYSIAGSGDGAQGVALASQLHP